MQKDLKQCQVAVIAVAVGQGQAVEVGAAVGLVAAVVVGWVAQKKGVCSAVLVVEAVLVPVSRLCLFLTLWCEKY